ncbi:saccharopine dehydrogenase family protein [Biformimicrobium ophioploci]|uniref:saccharopine dehydrogenase family protein n=1 Tax=Biformimicrobium ophioploci TaxID=3036711 RepID=UPI0025537729|nr:saccharopine dehydrogenase NADP-binding domain-containing protein [Microbulbifer sp. NKW57]
MPHRLPHPLPEAHYRVLVLGGYGVFGSRITRQLASHHDPDNPVHLIIAGRNKIKADKLAEQLPCSAEGLRLNRNAINLPALLQALNIRLVIHCAGPFQGQDYRVAEACLANKIHYIDIADARRFVCDISRLNESAVKQGVSIVSGAGALPTISSAVLARTAPGFATIEECHICIAPGHQIQRGIAIVRAGFESLGADFPQLADGRWHSTFSGNHHRLCELGHPVGKREVCDFDVPDLELWPQRVQGIRTVTFGTGLQPRLLQKGLNAWAHLFRFMRQLGKTHIAKWGHKLAEIWPGGSPHGGMSVTIRGTNQDGRRISLKWEALGLNGSGPDIAAAPAAALALKIIRGEPVTNGAYPSWNTVSLEEILSSLDNEPVVTSTLVTPD